MPFPHSLVEKPFHRGGLVLWVVLMLALISGCTHTHTMMPGAAADFFDQVNTSTKNRVVTIRLSNGDERRGVNVRVTPDSVMWLVPDAWTRQFTELRGVPLAEVKEIVVVNRIKGGLIGLGLGFMAGGAFGTIPAALNQRGGGQDTGALLTMGGLFAAAGGVGGIVAGARKGVTDVYVFAEFLEGSDRSLLSQQMKGVSPDIVLLFNRLRSSIRGMESEQITEKITGANIVYTSKDRQFCYLVAGDRDVRIYLPVKSGAISDPMGLLRPWSSGDSWFSLVPGGDMEYAISLIRQVYQRTL